MSYRPSAGLAPMGAAGSGGMLTGALGALGGTLGCLLCLSAIGALGLFACVIALTAYTSMVYNFLSPSKINCLLIVFFFFFVEDFLDNYKKVAGLSAARPEQQIALITLFASLMYAVVCRLQRS